MAETGPIFASIGIPQGLVLDPDSREPRGCVRRAGELVSLSPDDYSCWEETATPRSIDASGEQSATTGVSGPSEQLQRLQTEGLVVGVDMANPLSGQVGDLRPIPRGVGAGNLGPDSDVFYIRPTGSSSEQMEVDPVTAMLWWEFDGATSLRAATTQVASRLKHMDAEALGALTTAFALALLGARLIHLDAPSGSS